MNIRHRMLALAFAAGGALAMPLAQAQTKVNLGVAIPAATHAFTAGIVFWANQAKADLEKAHPNLKVTVKTAANSGEQANQLQDLLTVTKIDTISVSRSKHEKRSVRSSCSTHPHATQSRQRSRRSAESSRRAFSSAPPHRGRVPG